MSGRYERRKPKRKGGAGRVVLIILAVIIGLAALAAGGGYLYIRSMMSKVNYVQMPPKTEPVAVTTQETDPPEQTATQATTEATTVETAPPPMKPEDIINILVVGQSAREGESAKLADTMILVSLNTYTKTVTLTSILRDSFARIPAYKNHKEGRNKITNVYALGYLWTGGTAGAMELMNTAMKLNFDVEVDYNVEIDFEQFIHIIDYLGGVQIDLTAEEAKYLNRETMYVKEPVQEGRNRLMGMPALAYARMRHAEGDRGDITRTERQRNLIEALIEQFRYMSVMELQKIASDCVLPFITTNMDPDTMTQLMLKCLPMLMDLKVEKGTCPYEGSHWGEMLDIFGDGVQHSIERFDEAANKKYMRAITEGETE